MINSLKTNNGAFANLTVTVQPESSHVDANTSLPPVKLVPTVQQQVEVSTSVSSPGSPPMRQVSLPKSVISPKSSGTAAIQRPTFDQIVKGISEPDFVVPLYHHTNNVVPTHALSLDAGRTYDPRLTQGFALSTAALKPYERLTGISHERPEIVMMTEFQPLFNRDSHHHSPQFTAALDAAGMQQFKTPAGHYIDAQFNVKNLQVHNLRQTLNTVRTRYPHIARDFQVRTSTFSAATLRLKEDASFLLNLVRILEAQKLQLDLRHDIHVVDPHEVVDHLLQNFSQKRVAISPDRATHVLTTLVQQGNRKSFNCVDCMSDLGYSPSAVKDVFSSTKIWLQLNAELKSALKHHTLKLLDIDPSYQRNDRNASTVLKPPVKLFELADNLPPLPNLDDLVKLQVNGVSSVLRVLQPAYTSIYQNVFFKNEEARIAALAHLLSREFRYSKGLVDEGLRQRLTGFYNAKLNDVGNTSMFDSILGRSGNNIIDMPSNGETGVAAVAQRRLDNDDVLTFESKYVEGDVSLAVPGSEFYFDRILNTDGTRFDTSAIKSLSTLLRDQADNLSVVCDALNLFEIPSKTLGVRFMEVPLTHDVHSLDNSSDLVHQLVDQLINPRSGAAQPVALNDRLGAVYSQARRDPKLKSTLFLYSLARISRTYTNNVPFFNSSQTADNTPVVDYLIEQLVTALESTTPESRATIQLVTQRGLDQGLNTASLTNDSIRHALKSGTDMTRMIESFMSDILAQFRVKTQALSSSRTRYSATLDTVVMMMAFDLAISIVARYSNQSLVGVHKGLTTFSNGQTTYAISQTSTNHLSSFNELIQRLSSEGSLVREMLMTVLNTLRKLSGSLQGVSNYLESPEALGKLHEIATALGNDRQMIQMLFSEQQILLLASTVENLLAASGSGRTRNAGSSQTNTQQISHELAVLDESEVSPQLYEALMGFLNTGELVGSHGQNKRIMTIGIPQGFSRHLKQRVNIRSQKRATFQNKRSDIINVCVYKLDIQNADIVYRPVKYLFELSRFPTRLTTVNWLPIVNEPSLNDIINAIPTQSFNQDPNGSTSNSISSGIEYASTAIADSDGITGARAAFADRSYDFLRPRQKAEILNNHVVSQLLEAYIKLMTGINVAEQSYHMSEQPLHVDPDLLKSIADHITSHVSDNASIKTLDRLSNVGSSRSGGVLFSTTSSRKVASATGAGAVKGLSHPILSNPAGTAGAVSPASEFRSIQQVSQTSKTMEQMNAVPSAATSLDTLGPRHADIMMSHFKSVSGFARTLSSMSRVSALNHAVLGPKQFDRVFNILIDPRDFQVDVEKTMQTPYGRQALELMIQHGDIVSSDRDVASDAQLSRGLSRGALSVGPLEGRSFPQGRLPDNVNLFRYRDRDKSQGDLTADRYFVTIETFGEDEV